MKILLRLRPCSQALSLRLAGDPAMAAALGARPNGAGFLFPGWFDAASPVLPALLSSAAGEEISFLRDMRFSARELREAPRLEVLPRKTVAQAPADIEATRRAYAAQEPEPSAGGWRVRLPREIFLSRPVPPDTAAHVDQWTGEHVLGAAAAAALRGSGLSGWRLRPVLHPRTGQPHGDAQHLWTEELLPAASMDSTRFETPCEGHAAGQPTPRRYGCLSYPAGALRGAPDFARTAEPWDAWETPAWTLSPAACGWAGANLKGWAFRPMLEEGTPAHAEHGKLWSALLATLAQHPHAGVMA